MATTKKPAKKATGTAVTVWEKQMAEAAKKQAQAVKPIGAFKSISFKGGLYIDEVRQKNDEIHVVVLVGCHENAKYEGEYRPDVPAVPICYAFSEPDGKDGALVPHEKAKKPQCATCADCEHNVMGSAERGRGKACKNLYRLLVTTEDAVESATAMEEAEIRLVKIPVTSVKNWSKYVHTLDDEMKRPSWGVVTTMRRVDDKDTQFKVEFEFEELVNFDQEVYDALQKRIVTASRDIVAPYPDMEEQPAAKPKTIKGKATVAAKKPAAKKPVRR